MKPFLHLRKASWLAYVAALGVAGGLILLFLMVEASSQPQFCGSCHVMTPYFESWKESPHREVACVECHIPPGVTHEIQKKWEALSMVASYFTGTYGTNPWTEIGDAACLECHQRSLLSTEEPYGAVFFDHRPHLTELRQGGRLRCTSCHSQIVKGEHITVTSSTCILCHFKGEAVRETSRCTLCHAVPHKIIKKGLLSFDHGDVERFDMPCQSCHSLPSSGQEGRVPQERCLTCHNDPAQLNQLADTLLMHQMHVTEHKVDCLNCHLEIEHGEPRHPEESASQTECASCHGAGHSSQHSLYAGIGGSGVPPMPAPMFLAGVSCQACHSQRRGQKSETLLDTQISCMSCHGPRYLPVFSRWKKGMADRTRAMRRELAATESILGDTTSQALADARSNLELVERGNGIHNVRFSYALLTQSHQLINQARAQAQRAPLDLPWPQVPYETTCLECHQGIESWSGRIFSREFDHENHVVRRALACQECHRPHPEKEPGEVLRFGAEGCESCHHQDAGDDCLSCHSDITQDTVLSFRGEFAHSLHLDFADSCADCHNLKPGAGVFLEREVCSACH